MMNLLDGWFKLNPGEGAFYAIFGFLFVFIGIALLIAILYLVGYVMVKANARKAKAKKEEEVPVKASEPAVEEGISPEIVAAITAAVAVVMEEGTQKCDFVVRKIRKI